MNSGHFSSGLSADAVARILMLWAGTMMHESAHMRRERNRDALHVRLPRKPKWINKRLRSR